MLPSIHYLIMTMVCVVVLIFIAFVGKLQSSQRSWLYGDWVIAEDIVRGCAGCYLPMQETLTFKEDDATVGDLKVKFEKYRVGDSGEVSVYFDGGYHRLIVFRIDENTILVHNQFQEMIYKRDGS